MNTSHYYAAGLHRLGYTLQTAQRVPAIARALACAEIARQRRIALAKKIATTITHNKGAPND